MPRTLVGMDIDYPQSIVRRVDAAVELLRADRPNVRYVVDVVGHGASKYAMTWVRWLRSAPCPTIRCLIKEPTDGTVRLIRHIRRVAGPSRSR